MVSIPTVSGKGNEEQYKIQEYRECLREEFRKLFDTAECFSIGDALLCRLPAGHSEGGDDHSQKRPVLFTGHMDVVPVLSASTWRYPPFSGRIEGDELWGRGSQDMKGPHCALLWGLNESLMEGWVPDRDIWLYFSCDEEIGGATTGLAADFFKERGIRFEAVFDEGGNIIENFMGLVEGKAAMIGIAEKGSLEYRITAKSSGGHAASPKPGSAIARIADFVHDMENQDIFERELCDTNRWMLREISRCCPAHMKEKIRQASEEKAPYHILREICPEADVLLGGTIAFTMIEGGCAFNVMPQQVVLTANVRTSIIENEAQITEKLKRIAAGYDLEVELAGGSDAVRETSIDGSAYKAMKASVQEIFPGLPVIPFVLNGGTDSSHFVDIADQILRFNPIYSTPEQGRGVHGDNEFVSIRSVKKAAECYRCFFMKYL